ncbi:MAG: class I SAM-dependent methyltransferase [Prosthecobacter sp.]|jgi:cyclopropane fatty-acyl-phospholipid synthase-like methyltransferase|uniref:class I SAM-dependent methyltransferase n=1 Tax=Prosthecobacter sp. TaxID=1965333 RepID=UPI0019FDC214|nr:class I SAM-dependent methyltransferase [Prosthecobacter sp.]MBE2282311.1 class I SAM-dependent methyltransferase [Prosthecobacter sp.]
MLEKPLVNAPPAQDDETALFRKSWTLYDALSEKNYMFHREIYQLVEELLKQRHQQGPCRLLDLGCGNARFLAPCLRAAPPATYHGVDLSASALDEARDYLREVASVTLHHKDMLRAVEEVDSAFDIIFTGFAVHHLDSAAKQRLFHACAARLAAGGSLIMVDVVREERQSREQYLEGYLGTMRSEWTAVPPDELAQACAHVAAYDFPETLSDLMTMAQKAGLARSEVVGRFVQHHVLVFRP